MQEFPPSWHLWAGEHTCRQMGRQSQSGLYLNQPRLIVRHMSGESILEVASCSWSHIHIQVLPYHPPRPQARKSKEETSPVPFSNSWPIEIWAQENGGWFIHYILELFLTWLQITGKTTKLSHWLITELGVPNHCVTNARSLWLTAHRPKVREVAPASNVVIYTVHPHLQATSLSSNSPLCVSWMSGSPC